MVNRYIKVSDRGFEKVIDTKLMIPHVECYLIEDNKLYSESIDGIIYCLGEIVKQSDSIEDVF